MPTEDRYSIREVSELCVIPSKTLRYYDAIGLVIPEFRDNISRYRYYSKTQMVTLCIVRKLQAMGFRLKEIHTIILGNKANTLEKNIEDKLVEMTGEINSLQKKYTEMDTFLQRLKTGVDILNIQNDISTDNISIIEVPKTQLVYTRSTMSNYSNIEVSLKRWIEIVELYETLNLKSIGTIIVTYYCNSLEQFLCTDTDIEFGILIETAKDGDCYREFGGFHAATMIHVGNYADIVQTHIRLVQWINQNNYKIVGPVSEEFIISPLDVSNIEEHVTKIIIPVEKKEKKKKETL